MVTFQNQTLGLSTNLCEYKDNQRFKTKKELEKEKQKGAEVQELGELYNLYSLVRKTTCT